jgi:hypothetical protein
MRLVAWLVRKLLGWLLKPSHNLAIGLKLGTEGGTEHG